MEDYVNLTSDGGVRKKILTAGEALFGFVMLGIFIGMLQKRLS